MDPISIIVGMLGMATQTAGNLYTARARRNEALFQEQEAKDNAELARQAQTDAIQRGQQQEGYARMKAGGEIAAARAQAGASGVDGTVGSPVDAMADLRMMSEMDALTLRNNAAREAWGYQVEEKKQEREAGMARQRADNAFVSTILGGGGDMLQRGGNLGASLYSAGAFKGPPKAPAKGGG